MRAQLFIAIIIAALPGCGNTSVFSNVASDPSSNVFGNAEAAATLKNATSAQAFRVPAQQDYSGRVTPEMLDNEKMLAGPVPVPAEFSSELKSILLDRSIYNWDTDKGCIPNYGVRVQFEADGNRLDVLFCFQCDILMVHHDGKVVFGEDFDDANDRLVAIMKKLFPKDELIQSLNK